MITAIMQFVEAERVRRKTQTAVVVGLYSGMAVNFVLFSLFWLGVFTGQDPVSFLATKTNSLPEFIAKLLGALFYLFIGAATAWGYSELAVSLVAALFGIYSAGLVQEASDVRAKWVATIVLGGLVIMGAPYMMLVGIMSIRSMTGVKTPIDIIGLLIGGTVTTMITIVGPGLLSNPMTREQAESLVLTKLLGAATSSASKAMVDNPMMALTFLENQLPPPGWPLYQDPTQLRALMPPDDFTRMCRVMGQGWRMAVPPDRTPPKMGIMFKPISESSQDQSPPSQ